METWLSYGHADQEFQDQSWSLLTAGQGRSTDMGHRFLRTMQATAQGHLPSPSESPSGPWRASPGLSHRLLAAGLKQKRQEVGPFQKWPRLTLDTVSPYLLGEAGSLAETLPLWGSAAACPEVPLRTCLSQGSPRSPGCSIPCTIYCLQPLPHPHSALPGLGARVKEGHTATPSPKGAPRQVPRTGPWRHHPLQMAQWLALQLHTQTGPQ